jgi:hypothetical protein
VLELQKKYGYAGAWRIKGYLKKGYGVHLGETTIRKIMALNRRVHLAPQRPVAEVNSKTPHMLPVRKRQVLLPVIRLNGRMPLSRTWAPHLTDQLWNPSTTPNVVGETRAELVDNLTRYALTF